MGERAIIHVEGVEFIRDRPFAREVAIAYFDDRPTASWLAMPESEWEAWASNEDGSRDRRQLCSPDGLDPQTLAVVLRNALKGMTVYAHWHLSVNWWLRLLQKAAGEDLSISVRDARTLVASYDKDEALWRQALDDAYDLCPPTERAAIEARRLATFIRLLRSHPRSSRACNQTTKG
jgi:hypothetical protein